MKEQILELRAKGYTYNQIVEELGCSKGTVAYHCGEGQKEKNRDRQTRRRAENGGMDQKAYHFKNPDSRRAYYKAYTFQRDSDDSFTMEELYDHLGNNPKCYLTGRDIDLTDSSSYEFDHIEARSKGGSNGLDNLGLSLKEANRAKHTMDLNEFLDLCEEILRNHGRIK